MDGRDGITVHVLDGDGHASSSHGSIDMSIARSGGGSGSHGLVIIRSSGRLSIDGGKAEGETRCNGRVLLLGNRANSSRGGQNGKRRQDQEREESELHFEKKL